MNCFNKQSVDTAEQSLGINFPNGYRDFLTQLSREERERSFFSFHAYGDAEELIRINLLIDFEEWPLCTIEEPLVIGDDGCGDYWVIDSEDDDSSVYFLEHDPEGFSETTYSVNDLVLLIEDDINKRKTFDNEHSEQHKVAKASQSMLLKALMWFRFWR